ncbi:hypothetical protein FHX42_005255 [Saccharopolyspora lacisalsi]|uniref:Uncharacterized protein n=1 Tax=Halosaccharopolyspora lacisalsi TaxID=1000566 RepID=A0A839EAH7_9PSEU|nr:hypothetical protein [Halosaccharopolyspora lacisalsi]MBA8827848.1 hypothetical protein [Halosaccharopolyspora lacisalsi]
MAHTPSDGSTNPPIVALRQTRGSAPISGDLFTATADPLVVAFQTTVLFHDPNNGALTLPQLRQRWNASERGARAARRALIDRGFWVELDERQPNGRFRRITLFSEIRLGEQDLAELAIQYPPSSRIRCGGNDYLVGPSGELAHRSCTSADSGNVSAGHAESAPAQTRKLSTGPAPAQTRHDQGVHKTGPAPAQTRHDQEKQDISADHADSAPAQTDASSRRDDDEKHACMDVVSQFWKLISSSIAMIDPPGRSNVQSQVQTALQSGWTPESLTHWVHTQLTAAKKRTTVRSPAGFVISQLREIPAVAETAGPVEPKSDFPEWCGQCGDPDDPKRELKCRNNVRARTWPDGTPCSCRTADADAA